jgi:hypothetical protein
LLASARKSAQALHAMAPSCQGPSGSACTIAPVTIATMGTITEDRPATLAGSNPTIANQSALPIAPYTTVM